MPSGQNPRQSLLARYGRLDRRLENMRSEIPETATGATGTVDRALQAYTNTMSDIASSLRTASPDYKALRRRLSKIENGLDTNAERLSRANRQ
jgi:chromosome segregation ATPase